MEYRNPGTRGRQVSAFCVRIQASFLVLAAALIATNARAQTNNDMVEQVTITGRMVGNIGLTQTSGGGSRLVIPIIENPSTIQVVTGDLIRQRGLTTVLQAETQTAGVSFAATPGNGATALSYRGFTGVGSIMELYDGLQLQVASGTVSFPFDPWNVERIEVLGGPATVLYGQGGIGGTVNVVPRRPDFQSQHNEAQVSGGSFNTYRQALDTTGPIGSNLAYRLDISHVSSDNYVDRGKSQSVAVSASLAWQATPGLKFTLSDDYGNIEPMNYWGTPLLAGGMFNPGIKHKNFEVNDDPIRFLDNWTKLRTDWMVSDDISFTNDAYWLETYRHWRQLTNYVFQPASGLINRSSYREVFHHETQYGDQGVASMNSVIGGLVNNLSAGFQIQHIYYKPDNNTPFSGSSNVDPFSPDPGVFNFGVGTHPIFKTETNTYAFFGEDRIVLTSELSVVGGFRFDSLHVDYTDLTLGTKFADGGFNYSHSYNTPSGRVGIVYMPIPNLSVYGQYSTGNDSVSNLVSTSFTQINFELASGRQFEIGAKQSFLGGRGEWSLAAYDIKKKHLLVPDPTNPTISQQVGAQSSRGVEASVSFDIGYGLAIQGNGSILDAQFDQFAENVSGVAVSRNGNTPPFVPERTANVFFTWDFMPNWQLRGGYQFVAHRFANNADTFILPGYELASAGVRWNATQSLSVDLRVDNLFNRIYAENGVNGFSQYILGPPRVIELTLNSRF